MNLEVGPKLDGKPLLPGKAVKLLSQGPLEFAGRQVLFDPFTEGFVTWHVEGDANAVIVSGIVRFGKRTIALESCTVLSDFLLLDRGMLHPHHSDIPQPWLEKLSQGPVLLEEEYADFYAAYGNDQMPNPHVEKVVRLTDQWGTALEVISGAENEVRALQHRTSDQLWNTVKALQDLGWDVRNQNMLPIVMQNALTTEIIEDGDQLKLEATAHFGEMDCVLGDGNALFVDLGESVGLLDLAVLAKELPKRRSIRKTEIGEWESKSRTPDLLRQYLAPLEEVVPNSGFKGVLHPYQLEGLRRLWQWKQSGLGGILADEMGLGKTVQVLAFFSLLKLSHPILVVVPRSLLDQWRLEIEAFLPDMNVCVFYGSSRQLQAEGLILTTYGLLRQETQLQNLHYSAVVLDEAHQIKNPRSQSFKAAQSLKADFRLSVTGTPIENRPEELETQLKFAVPGAIKPGPFLLRRTKEEVAIDLPPKIIQDVWVTLTTDELSQYSALEAQIRQGLLEKPNQNKVEILEGILRLRQICSHPGLVFAKQLDREWSKCQRVISDCEEMVAEGAKVVIFSQFTSMLDVFEKKLSAPFLRLDGSTQNRSELVQQFQNDPDYPVFLISLKAGGVGLNLTAADYVLLYDPWWNEAVENQAIDRAHRIGRTSPVIARRYYAAQTIESRIKDLKDKKLELVEQLIL